MNVYELIEKLGGEIVRGKARYRKGNDYIVLGFLNGDDMIFTPEGRDLVVELANDSKPKRSRPAKSDVVESEQVPLIDDALAETLAAIEEKQTIEDVIPTTSEPVSQTGLT